MDACTCVCVRKKVLFERAHVYVLLEPSFVRDYSALLI